MARLLNAGVEPGTVGNSPGRLQKEGMKTFLRCVALFCLTVFMLVPAIGQITITSADVSAMLAIGRTVSSKTDTATNTADIGIPGATSWNFSALVTNFTSSATIVRPDATPFASYFPGSTLAEQVGSGGLEVYEYMALGTSLVIQGTGLTGFVQSRSRLVPDEVLYQLPMTMGTTWTTAYVDSTIVALPSPLPPQITLTSYTVSNSVDAYGSLTLPGGAVYQALRLRTDRRSTSNGHSTRLVTYSIIAANGANVSLTAADTLQASSGVINVTGISWSNPVASSVRLTDAVPAGFSLHQNYPNPFNPSTTIEFSVSTDGPVSLTITDVLGREVATLVNGMVSAGDHRVEWNAEGFANGVYMYRLNTGGNVESRKLMLLK